MPFVVWQSGVNCHGGIMFGGGMLNREPLDLMRDFKQKSLENDF